MSESSVKKVISIVNRHPPYGSNRAQQGLDIALAAAVFEQSVNYIFMDDGVYQLINSQNASSIQSKTLSAALETLDLYGIENVYTEMASLKARGLDSSDLALPVKVVTKEEISSIIEESDAVFNL